MTKQIIAGTIFPLAMAVSIYWLFRPHTIWVHALLDSIHFGQNINLLGESIRMKAGNTPRWLIHNFPDALWMFSFTTLILLIWKNQLSFHSSLWVSFILAIAIMLEVSQNFGLAGTYDFGDVLAYFYGAGASLFLYSDINQRLKQFFNEMD